MKKSEVLKGKPRLSIIMPVYNVAEYLKEAVDSVLGQTYADFELLLVDDGSTDESGCICDEYAKIDPRIKVMHKENGGVSSARNSGMDLAMGEYIAFIDSDDWYGSPFLIENCMKYLERDKSLDFVQFPRTSVRQDGTRINHNFIEAECKIEGCKNICAAYTDNIGTAEDGKITQLAWDKIFRNSLIKSMRFQDGRIFEDSAFSFKFMPLCTNSMLLPKNVGYYAYRVREGSITHSGHKRNYKKAYSWIMFLYELLQFHNEYTGKPDVQYESIALLTRIFAHERNGVDGMGDYDYTEVISYLKRIKVKGWPKSNKRRAAIIKILGWENYLNLVILIYKFNGNSVRLKNSLN